MSSIKLFVIFGVLACALATSTFHADCDSHFKLFQRRFMKRYHSEDQLAKRREIFCENMKKVDALNELNGKHGNVFGVTKFSDQSEEETKILLGRASGSPPEHAKSVRKPVKRGPFDADSTKVDWSAAGMTTPVKNQGQCGSCWAHSATEAAESEWMIRGNAPWEFSVQQVASCDTTSQGCGGGWTQAAYAYLQGLPAQEGLGSNAWGPYVQSMTSQCTSASCTESCSDLDFEGIVTEASLTGYYATLTGFDYAIPECSNNRHCNSQNMTAFAESVALLGPPSVCVNANTWVSYTGGVMTTSACGGNGILNMDHCVQLTGYNAEAETPYWIVRNSWATDWGENGYIFLEFDDTNPCGIANEATFPTLGATPADPSYI